jgi:hypothetical protein
LVIKYQKKYQKMDIPFKTISEYELDDVILKAIAHIVLATMMVKVKPRKMCAPPKVLNRDRGSKLIFHVAHHAFLVT